VAWRAGRYPFHTTLFHIALSGKREGGKDEEYSLVLSLNAASSAASYPENQ